MSSSDAVISRIENHTLHLEKELDAAMHELDSTNRPFHVDSDDSDVMSDDEMMVYQTTPTLVEALLSASLEDILPRTPLKENSTAISHTSSDQCDDFVSGTVDERILGDYSHWAIPVSTDLSSSRSLAGEILSGYYGLRSALSGRGSFSIPVGWEVLVVHVLEVILRPDTPLKVVMAGVAKVASVEHLRYEEILHNDDDTDDSGMRHTQSSHSKKVMSTAKTTPTGGHSTTLIGNDSRSGESVCFHAILSCKPVHRRVLHSHSPGTALPSPEGSSQWDAIDAQVCLSRSLKQRALVCQFVRLVPLKTGELSTVNPMQTPHPAPVTPNRRQPPPSLLATAAHIPLTRHAPVAANAPAPVHIESVFQRVFSKYLLSLSCLYALKGSAVSIPLDPHYISLVQGLLRYNMWASIRKEGEDMQVHIALMEEKFETMKLTMSSIYKQHGLAIPTGTGDLSRVSPLVSAIAPAPLGKATDAFIGSKCSGGDSEDDGEKKSSTVTTATVTMNGSDDIREEMKNETGVCGTPIASMSAVASMLAHNDIAAAPPLIFDDSSSEDDGNSLGLRGEDANANTGDDHGSTSVDRGCVMVDESDGLEFDVDAALESGGKGTTDFEFVGGGLGRCLLEMDALTTGYQKRCDEELTDRMTSRNDITIETVQNICARRRFLLSFLVHNQIAKDSSLSKSFRSTFDGVPLRLHVSRNQLQYPEERPSHSSNVHSPLRPPRDTQTTVEGVKALTPIKRLESSVDEEVVSDGLDSEVKSNTAQSPAPVSTSSWLTGLIWGGKSSTTSTATAASTEAVKEVVESNAVSSNAQDSSKNDRKVSSRSNRIDTVTPSALPVPPLPPPPSALVDMHDEVVLYYCACMVSYTASDMVGLPGFLYLSPRYIGLASRAGIGAAAKRRELLQLQDLFAVEVCGGHKAAHHSGSTTSTPVKEGAASTAANADGKQTATPGRVPSGWSLASIQQSLRLSNVASGCKLRFRLPVYATESMDLSPSQEPLASDRRNSLVDINHHADPRQRDDANDGVTYEVTVFPALVEAEKVRSVIIEARDMLSNAPPGA